MPLTVPDRPTNVAATAGDASASVSFTPPVDDGGTPVTSYGVTCQSFDGLGAATGTASGPASPIVVTGLTNGHMYFCTVTATNAVGTGYPVQSTGVIPGAAPAQVSDPPTNVSAAFGSASGNASATVSFSAPANDGGSVITGYTAKCLSSDGGDPGSGFDAASPVSTMGLTLGHTYQCSVTAMNGIGASLPSALSNTFVSGDGSRRTGEPHCDSRRRVGVGVVCGTGEQRWFGRQPVHGVVHVHGRRRFRRRIFGVVADRGVGADERQHVPVHGDGNECRRYERAVGLVEHGSCPRPFRPHPVPRLRFCTARPRQRCRGVHRRTAVRPSPATSPQSPPAERRCRVRRDRRPSRTSRRARTSSACGRRTPSVMARGRAGRTP